MSGWLDRSHMGEKHYQCHVAMAVRKPHLVSGNVYYQAHANRILSPLPFEVVKSVRLVISIANISIFAE